MLGRGEVCWGQNNHCTGNNPPSKMFMKGTKVSRCVVFAKCIERLFEQKVKKKPLTAVEIVKDKSLPLLSFVGIGSSHPPQHITPSITTYTLFSLILFVSM
jgi:putative SOS response-associated peptidase YedK